MNKTIMWVVIAVIVIAGGAYLLTRGPAGTDDTAMNADGTSTTGGSASTSGQGQVVFAVTDLAAQMGTISEISMRINKLEIHTQGGSWTTVSTTPKTYNLLALNASKESRLLADIKTKAGTYDQVRVNIDSVSVKTTAGTTKTAKLPSSVLTINTVLVVKGAEVSYVNLDFLAKESLHTTTVGDFIFAPVVKMNSMSSANLNIAANTVVTVESGHDEMASGVGMDIDGSVKANFSINPATKLGIDTAGKIKVETTTTP